MTLRFVGFVVCRSAVVGFPFVGLAFVGFTLGGLLVVGCAFVTLNPRNSIHSEVSLEYLYQLTAFVGQVLFRA